jgi:hypothetical protein
MVYRMILRNLNLQEKSKGAELLRQCRELLDELEQFQDYLTEQRKEGVELRHFKNSVKTECKLLEKVSKFARSLYYETLV